MDYLSHNIAENLKRIRSSRGISLDTVSEQTGVSKSMLHQIEHGSANPSINVLGKIASGLRIEFNALIASPPEESCLVKISELFPIKEIQHAYSVRTCFPFEENQKIEIYRIDLEPGGAYTSGSHGDGSREYIAVLSGEVFIDTGQEVRRLTTDDMLRFNSQYTHTYCNRSRKRASILSFFLP